MVLVIEKNGTIRGFDHVKTMTINDYVVDIKYFDCAYSVNEDNSHWLFDTDNFYAKREDVSKVIVGNHIFNLDHEDLVEDLEEDMEE